MILSQKHVSSHCTIRKYTLYRGNIIFQGDVLIKVEISSDR